MIHIKYPFSIGLLHARKNVEKNEEYVEIAEGVHKYLESVRVDDKDGIYWTVSGDTDGNVTIYTGSAGVTYFYAELYKLTGNKEYLEIINKASDYVDSNWEKCKKAAVDMMLSYGIIDDTGIEYSYYTGAAGVGEGLIAIYKLTGRQKELYAIREITDDIIDHAKQDSDGPYWGQDCSMLHNAGTMLYLYHAAECLGDEKIKRIADKAADRIVAKAERDIRGGYAWESTIHQGVNRVPNFEGGTAGTGYALATAYKYTPKKEYLNAAIEAAKHLKAIAVKKGDGFLIPWHDNPDEKPIFYLANCHGPAGTSKLFYSLYEITHEEKYLDDIKGLYYGMRYLGAPEKMSAGYWNTVCVCCGTAGILQFLINCSIIFKGTDFADEADKMAEIAAEILVGEQEKKLGGRTGVWPIAYERIKPENIAPDFGYGTGSSGIGVTLLQMYQFKNKEINWFRFIDDPYPTGISLK